MNIANIDKGQVDPSMLDRSLLFSQPLEVDWSAAYERMRSNGHIHVYRGVQCPECEKVVVTLDGFADHEEPDGTISYIETPDPTINRLYPLSKERDSDNLELYAALFHMLPVCFVEYGDQVGFSPTCGATESLWIIAETYIRIGYLPPVWLTLPEVQTAELDLRRVNIVKSVQESHRVATSLLSARADELSKQTRKE